MKAPKKTGSKPITRKPSNESEDNGEELDNDAKSGKYDEDEDDFDELPLDEIDSFDEYNSFDDDDDF